MQLKRGWNEYSCYYDYCQLLFLVLIESATLHQHTWIGQGQGTAWASPAKYHRKRWKDDYQDTQKDQEERFKQTQRGKTTRMKQNICDVNEDEDEHLLVCIQELIGSYQVISETGEDHHKILIAINKFTWETDLSHRVRPAHTLTDLRAWTDLHVC